MFRALRTIGRLAKAGAKRAATVTLVAAHTINRGGKTINIAAHRRNASRAIVSRKQKASRRAPILETPKQSRKRYRSMEADRLKQDQDYRRRWPKGGDV